MYELFIQVFVAIVVALVLYLMSLKQDLRDKERIIQNQQIEQRRQRQENKNKVFEEKWKVKKEEYSKSTREKYEKNDTINTSVGSYSIDF